jgi:hypothetical protein
MRNNSVIIRLTGGLGNQLFQYAYAKSVSVRANLPIKLDCQEYELKVFEHRPYKLDIFKIKASILTEEERAHFLNKPFVLRVLDKLKPSHKRSYFNEGLNYNPNTNKVSQAVYITGYFQSQMHFESCKDELRNDLVFKNEPVGENLEMFELINKTPNSVSIHVRRGDYLDISLFVKLGEEYYSKAIKYIENKLGNAHFFVFSNDIDWCKEYLTKYMTLYTFVDINDELSGYEDLRLMSSCQNNIIANSSFSWWGAWLNANLNKIVIAPLHNTVNKNFENEHPKEWIKL